MLKTLILTAVALAATFTVTVGGVTASSAQNAPNVRAAVPTRAVALTPEGGYRLGSATAAVRVVEYVSYTCSHCATFDAESAEPLRMLYVARGRTSVEVRPLVRDIVDLASASLARCGNPARFFERHHALMARQATTLAAAQAASPGWAAVRGAQRLARVAGDADLIAVVTPLGVTPAQAQLCLSDQAAIARIIAVSEAGSAAGVQGTPSFAINDALLGGVHSWAALRPRLDAALAAR